MLIRARSVSEADSKPATVPAYASVMSDEVRKARRLARVEIGSALSFPLLIGFEWIAKPGFMGESLYRPWYGDAPLWIAGAIYAFGLAWMIRIYRTSHLEPEPPPWQYGAARSKAAPPRRRFRAIRLRSVT